MADMISATFRSIKIANNIAPIGTGMIYPAQALGKKPIATATMLTVKKINPISIKFPVAMRISRLKM